MRSEKEIAWRLFKRVVSNPNPELDSYPRIISKCFQTSTFFGRIISEGYFLLTAMCLYFMIDYPGQPPRYAQGQYGFLSIQLKEITTVNGNIEKLFNLHAFVIGLIMLGGAVALFIYSLIFWGVLLSILAVVFIIGAYTFLSVVRYKITIGTAHGGITITGNSAKKGSGGIAWNQPMAVIYNARPVEAKLMEFVETLNWIVSSFQERGEYAFSEDSEQD